MGEAKRKRMNRQNRAEEIQRQFGRLGIDFSRPGFFDTPKSAPIREILRSTPNGCSRGCEAPMKTRRFAMFYLPCRHRRFEVEEA